MDQTYLTQLADRIAAHADGDNPSGKSHMSEFNDPAFKAPLNIRDRPELAARTVSTLLDPETVGFVQPNGQEYYYHRKSNFAVLLDNKGGGTVFRPNEFGDYLQRKHYLQEQKLGISLPLEQGGIGRFHPELLSETRASHGLSAVSVATDLAKGDYIGAAEDSAMAVADTKTAQQALTKAAVSIGAKEMFETVARKLPFVAGYLAYSSMQAEAHAFEEAGQPALAEAARMTGWAEVAGGAFGGFAADYSREAMRKSIIDVNGSQFEAIAKSGTRQILEVGYETGAQVVTSVISTVPGQPVHEVLPASHAAMAQGADDMGERSEISRIAVERAAGPAQGHLTILQDGSVQPGSIPSGNNPQIAAGKNGGTLGVLYYGSGTMNDAEWQTTRQVQDWLGQQRHAEGLSSSVELIAGSTGTAELLNLPTPRGPLPAVGAPQPSTSPVQNRQRLSNSM